MTMTYSTMSSRPHWNGTSEDTLVSQDVMTFRTNSPDPEPNTTSAYPGCLILQFQAFIPWDNPDNIVTLQVENLVRKIKDVFFLPVLFLIGGPANVINMAVFYQQGLAVRVNVCLFALSLVDELYLVFSMLLFGDQLYFHFTTKQRFGPVMTFMTNHYLVGLNGLHAVSQVLSAIIASERCFCILQPLRSQTVLRTSTMTAIIVAVNVLVMGLNFVMVARYNIVCAYDPVSDNVVMTMIGSQFYLRHKRLMDILFIYVYGVGFPSVVMVVVTTTTITTAIKLRQAAAWRASTSSSGSVSPREIALTRMLVYNSAFFIVCVFPLALFRFVFPFIPNMNAGRGHHNFYMLCLWVINVFTYINATFNFLVYYTMGSRYRHTFWTLVGRKSTKTKANETTEIVTTVSTAP